MVDHPLRKFRTGLGLTLRGLSAETGASIAALSRIENRKQDPDLDFLRQLSALAARRRVELNLDDFLSVRPKREAEQSGAAA